MFRNRFSSDAICANSLSFSSSDFFASITWAMCARKEPVLMAAPPLISPLQLTRSGHYRIIVIRLHFPNSQVFLKHAKRHQKWLWFFTILESCWKVRKTMVVYTTPVRFLLPKKRIKLNCVCGRTWDWLCHRQAWHTSIELWGRRPPFWPRGYQSRLGHCPWCRPWQADADQVGSLSHLSTKETKLT